MLLYPPGAVAAVLHVNQGSRARAPERRLLRQRALQRELSRAAVRIERSERYRESLGEVLEQVASFERGLDAAAKERWLALEEALLEHASRLQAAYFSAGVECGARRWGARRSHAQRLPSEEGEQPRSARDAELIRALADIIAKLALR